jgi:hypothetical protein
MVDGEALGPVELSRPDVPPGSVIYCGAAETDLRVVDHHPSDDPGGVRDSRAPTIRRSSISSKRMDVERFVGLVTPDYYPFGADVKTCLRRDQPNEISGENAAIHTW